MCQIVETSALHRELVDYFDDIDEDRLVNDHYVEQFEPWTEPADEEWTDADSEIVAP